MQIILYPPQSSIAFSILGIDIRFYGLIMSFAMFCGLIICYFLFKKYYSNKDLDNFLDFVPITIISAVIGARMFYVIGDWSFYSKHPLEIIMIHHGGISIFGALSFGLLSIYIYSKKMNFSFVKYADIFAIAMPFCQAIGRWGNFANQEAYGHASNGFIKMYIDFAHRYPIYQNVEYYHPAFLYESIFDIVLFIILICLFMRFKTKKTGMYLFLYLFFYSFIRLIIESIRIDSVCTVFGVSIASYICMLIIFILIAYFLVKKLKNKNSL